MFKFVVQTLILIFCYNVVRGQNLNNNVTWCTISQAEQDKCNAFSRAVDRDIGYFGNSYISLRCVKAFDKEDCMRMLDEEKAHLTALDAGEVFMAARHYSLIPIMQEIYEGVGIQYAVAMIKKGSLREVQALTDLRGKKACFAGVGTLAGWIIPINVLMKEGGLEVIDCNNDVKSAINYFGPSCAVNSLINKYNPLGDNSDKLCKLCVGKLPDEKCTSADPHASYEGATRCLVDAGEIAFLVHTTLEGMMAQSTNDNVTTINASLRKDQFELLCRDGTRKSVDDYKRCHWGMVPSRAIVSSSAVKLPTRRSYQRFLTKAVQLYSNANNASVIYDNRLESDLENRPGFEENADNRMNYDDNPSETPSYRYWNKEANAVGETPSIQPIEVFHLFESVPRYGGRHNLMFTDVSKDLIPIPETHQTFTKYLGRALDFIMGVRNCPVNKMYLCVTSDAEMIKCNQMKTALRAQLLKPELECKKGHSHIACMRDVREGKADVTILDASDVYTAGSRYDLIPFLSEVYNLGTSDYYVVAVARVEDPVTDLTYLKNKNTCHSGVFTAAGWVYPMAYLLENSWIRGYGCDSIRAAAEYFGKSCIPGALSSEYNTGVPYDNMCHLCHGGSFRYCRRDASEDYYGHTGALRCLVEGGGDVAFVKHTTVAENASGKRRSFWARNTFVQDFELLCQDGTRNSTTGYQNCNMGKVAANAVVTRGGEGYNETEINAYVNLFIYAQQFYGLKEPQDFSFSMFYSPEPYSDLIFQDVTQQLRVVPKEKRHYRSYLGNEFLRARRTVDCKAAAGNNFYSLFNTIFVIAITFILFS